MIPSLAQLPPTAFAVLFTLAAVTKARPTPEWKSLVRSVVRPRLVTVTLVAVPAIEAVVAALLLVRPVVGLVCAAVVLAMFAAVVLRLGKELGGAGCGCFGRFAASRIGPGLAIRNALLASIAASCAIAVSSKGDALPQSPLLLMVALGAVAITAVVRAAKASTRGPRVGSRPRLPGGGRGPLIAVFLAPGCPACERLLTDLGRLGSVAPLAVILPPGLDEKARTSLGTDVAQFVRPDLSALFDRWRIPGTPYAVVLDRSGTVVASKLGSTANELEQMTRWLKSAPAASGALVSRRAVLAGALNVAGLLLLAGPQAALARRRWGNTAAADPNVFTGDRCAAFRRWIVQTGVTNRFGEAKKGVVGVANSDPELDPGPVRMREERSGQVFCRCNNTIYDNVQACLNECEVSLGCFAGVCEPYAGGEVCMQGIVESPSVRMRPEIRIVRWRPRVRLTGRCAAYVAAFEAEVSAHEAMHVKDHERRGDEALKNLRNSTYRACAPTRAEAMARVEAMINSHLEFVGQELLYAVDQDAKRRHASDLPPIPFECAVCP